MTALSPLRRRELAAQLIESEGWQFIVLPHIATQLAAVESDLLTKRLTMEQAEARRDVRARLVELRDLPAGIANTRAEEL